MLVNRLVHDREPGPWHICPADWRFTDGAIVTLEALCEHWCYGTLTRDGIEEFRRRRPNAAICPDCLEMYNIGLETAWREEW